MVIIDALVVVSFILLVILLVRVSRLVQAVDALSEKFCEPGVDNSDIAASAPIAVPASMSAPTPAVPSASTPEPVLAAAPVPTPGPVAAWVPAPMAQVAPASRMREFDDAALDPAPAVRAPGSGRDVESWIGRNALGVMASVLVFLGLVFLGVTFVPQWPDWVKVASMFALSCVLVGVGGVLSWRHKNGFTSALMGCGAGSLFISVFLTHLYFGMLGEVQAYALLLGWMALCLALVRKTDSMLLFVVLQLGLAISICLGYSGSLAEGRLALLLVYQIAANAMMAGGSMLFYRRMYRVSLALALVLGVVASCFMWGYANQGAVYGFGFALWRDTLADPVFPLALAFLVQLASAGVLAALLIRASVSDFQNQGEHDMRPSDTPKPASESDGLSPANADAPTQPGVQSSANSSSRASAALLAGGAACWILAVRFDLFLVAQYWLSWLLESWGPSLLVGSHVEYVSATVATLAALALVALSMFALARFAQRQSKSASEAIRPALSVLLAGGSCLALQPAFFVYGSSVVGLGWMWVWALAVMQMARVCRNDAYRLLALVLVAMDAAFFSLVSFASISSQMSGVGSVALGGACALALCGFAGAIVRMLRPPAAGIVAYAVGCTIVIMSYLHHCTPLAAEGYQWSVCCMACALVCVALGFRRGVGGLRLYGLVLAILCVAKLVLLDMAGLDSMARVAACIVGGMICFAISALYNYVVRRMPSEPQ